VEEEASRSIERENGEETEADIMGGDEHGETQR